MKISKRIIKALCAVLCVLLLLSSCMNAPAPAVTEKADTAPEKEETVTETAVITETEAETEAETQPAAAKPEDVLARFDTDLLNFVASGTAGNFVVSPISLKYALGLSLAGADGKTKEQILNAVCPDEAVFEDYIKKFNRFVEYFEHESELMKEDYRDNPSKYPLSPDDSLKVADSVWRRRDLPELKDGYRLASEMYGAELKEFDRQTVISDVNEWVRKNTGNMIKKTLPESYDVKDLAVLIVNALYFKDAWASVFEVYGEDDFTTKDGDVVKKEFIKCKLRCGYYKDEKTQILDVPMRHSVSVAFVIGSTDDLHNNLEKMSRSDITVYLPKIDVETSLTHGELCDFLKERGVTDAFVKDSADFSRMSDTQLYISDIIQKAKLSLDENGVEASAATVIAHDTYSLPSTVRINRAFSFFIHTTETNGETGANAVLFEGMVIK